MRIGAVGPFVFALWLQGCASRATDHPPEPADGPLPVPGAAEPATVEVQSVQVPRAWLSCASDAECRMVDTGCCVRQAVRAGHEGELQGRLDPSHARTCEMACPFEEAAVCSEGLCRASGG
jgi:hypothetical protein